MIDITTGVIVGNGASKIIYKNLPKSYQTGKFILGCNIPDADIYVDATVICDVEIIFILKNYLNLVSVPVILSTQAFSKMKELGIVRYFEILHVFNPKEWHNCGHYGAEYLINTDHNQIEIFGCDSIFEDTIASSTDDYVPKENKTHQGFIDNWRIVWKKMFVDYPDVKFNIHEI